MGRYEGLEFLELWSEETSFRSFRGECTPSGDVMSGQKVKGLAGG